jgi:hypothetical protein
VSICLFQSNLSRPPRRHPAISKPSTQLRDLQAALAKRVKAQGVARWESAGALLGQFATLREAEYKTDLPAFDTFLPPRLVSSAKERQLVGFFGAGVSAEAGVPLWWDLLSTLGIPRDIAAQSCSETKRRTPDQR